jgi:hypothetical protein
MFDVPAGIQTHPFPNTVSETCHCVFQFSAGSCKAEGSCLISASRENRKFCYKVEQMFSVISVTVSSPTQPSTEGTWRAWLTFFKSAGWVFSEVPRILNTISFFWGLSAEATILKFETNVAERYILQRIDPLLSGDSMNNGRCYVTRLNNRTTGLCNSFLSNGSVNTFSRKQIRM